MKKITILSIAILTIGLVSGCAGKDEPFTVAADGHTVESDDTTVTPVDSKTDIAGATGSGDETITPTGGDELSDYVASAPTPTTPPATEGVGVVDDAPEIGTPPSEAPSTGGGDTAVAETPTIRLPDSAVISPLPRPFMTLPGVIVISQHDQDVAHLMNDTFQPDEFTAYEQQVQSRIVAERAAVSEDLAIELKGYVVAVLQALIHAERNDTNVFRARTSKLSRVIAAFKSGDLLRSMNSVYDGELSHRGLWAAAFNHPDQLKKAGSYLEIQFAESMKDMTKASLQARAEVHASSTLVIGGDGLYLVYKPDGFLDQGFNHIRGLENADLWYEGAGNWRAVAEGIRGALNAELHPEAAADAARAIEEAARSLQEGTERITREIGRW